MEFKGPSTNTQHWRLILGKNQILCVPLNGPHPSIVLFHFWFSLTLCPPAAVIYFVSYLIPPLHLICLTSYVLLDFFQRISYFPSFTSILISLSSADHIDLHFHTLWFYLGAWTYGHAYQTCSIHLDQLVSHFQAAFCGLHLSYIWFYCIFFSKK